MIPEDRAQFLVFSTSAPAHVKGRGVCPLVKGVPLANFRRSVIQVSFDLASFGIVVNFELIRSLNLTCFTTFSDQFLVFSCLEKAFCFPLCLFWVANLLAFRTGGCERFWFLFRLIRSNSKFKFEGKIKLLKTKTLRRHSTLFWLCSVRSDVI